MLCGSTFHSPRTNWRHGTFLEEDSECSEAEIHCFSQSEVVST